MDRLVSKIFAGGISAGVFLIWWPQHVHSEDLTHLVIRGLLWTLTFELLLLSFGPAEDGVRRRLKSRLEQRRGLVRLKLDAVPATARTGGTLALACMGLALPAFLLAGGPTEIVEADAPPKVVKQVVVERPVIEKKVVVRRVVERGGALQSAGAAPSVAQTTPVKAARPAAKKAAAPAKTKVVTERTSAPKKAATTQTAPKPTATEPAAEAPAATPTTDQPIAAADATAPATTPQP